MRVVLDTNFLIDAVKFKVGIGHIHDLVGLTELVTLNSVENELAIISEKTSRAGAHAKVALKLVKENNIKILKSEGRPDNAMVKLAGDKTIIATNDVELRKRLKALGMKTIYLKSKKHLAIG